MERADKPDSVLRLEREGAVIYLGRRSPADSCTLPAASSRRNRDGTPLAAYLGLLAVGFTLPRTSPSARCALTAPFHPYLEIRQSVRPPSSQNRCGLDPPVSSHSGVFGAVSFLWHFPSARAGLALPTTVPYPVRTFLTPANAPPFDRPQWGRQATDARARAIALAHSTVGPVYAGSRQPSAVSGEAASVGHAFSDNRWLKAEG